MPTNTIDAVVAALPPAAISYSKTSVNTAVGGHYSYWDATGNPGAGVLAIGNTTTGVVPTKNTAGAIPIVNAGAGFKLELLRWYHESSAAHGMRIYDRCWHAGSFALTPAGNISGWTGTTVVTRPSTGEGLVLWAEINTATSNTASTITVTYTNSDGTSDRTATLALPASQPNKRMLPFAMAAGDRGIRSIQTINIGTAVATGSMNLIILNSIAEGGITQAGTGFNPPQDFARTGKPRIYDDACLTMMVLASGTAGGLMTGSIALGVTAE